MNDETEEVIAYLVPHKRRGLPGEPLGLAVSRGKDSPETRAENDAARAWYEKYGWPKRMSFRRTGAKLEAAKRETA